MSQGAFGPIGVTGPTGMTGRKGHQGDGFGYTGANMFAPGGVLSFSSISNTSPYALTVTTASSGTYYKFTLSTVTGYGYLPAGSQTLTLSSGGPFVANDQLQGPNVYPGTYVVSVTNSTTYTVYPALSHMTGFDTITTIPRVTLTLPTSGLVSGMFWVFSSTTGGLPTKMQITLVNGTAVYNGNSAATFVETAIGNSIILAYSGTGTTYIVF